MAVIRLATLTGLPNQSRARLTAQPDAMPIRSCGSVSSRPAASANSSIASISLTGFGQTNITASPIVLTSRTGGSTNSRARSTRRSTNRTRSSGGTPSPSPVKPTMSANATASRRAPGSAVPEALSLAFSSSPSTARRSCTIVMSQIIGPRTGSIWRIIASYACASSSSVIPGRKTTDIAPYCMAGTARERPSASLRTIKITRSASSPISISCCGRTAVSASART